MPAAATAVAQQPTGGLPATAGEPTHSAADAPPPGQRQLVVPLDRPWDSATATRVWEAALAELDDLTADFARQAASIEPLGSNRLRLVFPAEKELAKRSCERGDRKSRLEATIKAVSARDVHVECDLCAISATPPKPTKTPAAVARRQLMRDAEGHPMVQELIELFEAEIVRVDPPHG